jgi:activator of HSP90 ATPase
MTNTNNLKQSFILECAPEVVFKAWLDSKLHGEMLASPGEATIDPKIGGEFSIWDGAITGKTLEVDDKNFRIIQDWRYDYDDWSVEFPSKLTMEFLPHDNGQTKVMVSQTNIPENHTKEIGEGWEQYYWAPMKEYFATHHA